METHRRWFYLVSLFYVRLAIDYALACNTAFRLPELYV